MTTKARFQRTFAITEEENKKLETVLKSGVKFIDFIRNAIDTAYKKVSKEQGQK
jgi:hypothetical protein